MDLRIYSIKANSQAGNKWVYVMTTQKAKAARYSAWGLKHLRIFPENLTGDFRSKREG